MQLTDQRALRFSGPFRGRGSGWTVNGDAENHFSSFKTPETAGTGSNNLVAPPADRRLCRVCPLVPALFTPSPHALTIRIDVQAKGLFQGGDFGLQFFNMPAKVNNARAMNLVPRVIFGFDTGEVVLKVLRAFGHIQKPVEVRHVVTACPIAKNLGHAGG